MCQLPTSCSLHANQGGVESAEPPPLEEGGQVMSEVSSLPNETIGMVNEDGRKIKKRKRAGQ